MPAEAIYALQLLWKYYLAHVVLIMLFMWLSYISLPLRYARLATLFILGMVPVWELWQLTTPILGDAAWDDVWVGVCSVIVFFTMFDSIRRRRT